MSKSLNVEDSQIKTSLLQHILSVFTKNDNVKQNKELEQYDNIEFIDVNKEISMKEASSNGKSVNSKVVLSTKE